MDTQFTVEDPKHEVAEAQDRNFQEDVKAAGADIYAKTQQAAAEAYEKSAQVAEETYSSAKLFSCENPAKTVAIAFGVGLGVGILLASRRSRTSRSAHAVVDALYDVASTMLR
jgi:ElaB/YqjD/DUF883 family membrane-anchored ribosome-binding protein